MQEREPYERERPGEAAALLEGSDRGVVSGGGQKAPVSSSSGRRTASLDAASQATPGRGDAQAEAGGERADGAADKPGSNEVDSQLLYLKQSLERIAAGRDQKLSEEPHRRHKLTAAEEQVILEILKEYLS